MTAWIFPGLEASASSATSGEWLYTIGLRDLGPGFCIMRGASEWFFIWRSRFRQVLVVGRCGFGDVAAGHLGAFTPFTPYVRRVMRGPVARNASMLECALVLRMISRVLYPRGVIWSLPSIVWERGCRIPEERQGMLPVLGELYRPGLTS